MNPKTAIDTHVRGRIRVEHGTKRIRAFLAGELVADTTSPLLVWEKPCSPTYYFPPADFHTELLAPDGNVSFYTDKVALHLDGVKQS